MNLNKVQIIGNVTKDAEVKEFPNGKLVTVTIATNEEYKDRNGNAVKNTEYHTVILYGFSADFAAKHVRKGAGVYVEGSISTRTWQSDGKTHYKTEIKGQTIQMLKWPPQAEGTQPAPTNTPPPSNNPADETNKANDIEDSEDLPF